MFSKTLSQTSLILTLLRSCVLLFLVCISCTTKDNDNSGTLGKSEEWMWAQQSEDGGWHSRTHNVLKDGRVLTPYILFHLTGDSVNDNRHTAAINNALEFIRRELNAAISDTTLTLSDYPNYSAAYALRVLHRFQVDSSLQRIIAEYLITQRFDEERGFTKDSLAYGGWGYGEPDLPFGKYGHVDISHTRRVIAAVMECRFVKAEAKAKAKESVKYFLKGIQRQPGDSRIYEGCKSREHLPYDGGFVASVVTLSTIKSEPVEIDS